MTNDDLNEVFREFGYASFCAYTFESALAALAGTLRVMTFPYHTKQEIREYDAYLRAKLTAGKLITEELDALTKESPDWKAFLTQITEVRNRLIHRFYEEQLPNLNSESGRKVALQELQAIGHQLSRASKAVKTLYVSIAEEHLGFNDEHFRERADKIVKQWTVE